MFALNVYDENIVTNHGVEIKEKGPLYVSAIKIDPDGILCYPTHYNFGHHVNMQFN